MWERKVAGVKYILDQLLQAPEVPKWEHLGQPIYLNSTQKLELELALKNGLTWGRYFLAILCQ